jgi:hypothetical protein
VKAAAQFAALAIALAIFGAAMFAIGASSSAAPPAPQAKITERIA